jgi:hypothetical protein
MLEIGCTKSKSKEIAMLKVVTLLAAGLLIASANFATAKSAKSVAPGHQVKGAHGASYNAPGHVKKRKGLKSAHTVAPGHKK